MFSVSLLFYILALVCLVLAALGVPSSRVSLGWLGMALWLLGTLVRS